MRTPYVAYGLQLHSFPLPGMTPQTAPKLPALAIERCSAQELDRHWSGPDGQPPWQGRVGDGTALTIERGEHGDTLFTYGARARYLLDPSRRALRCAPSEEGLHWQQTLLGRVLPNVSLACGYEALHASAVESPAGVIALAAPSGMGKTTLALELTRRGWPLVTDDVLILEDGPEQVRAHPGSPHMNVATGQLSDGTSAEIGRTLGILAGERWVAARAPSRAPQPMRAVCLLERGAHLSLGAQPLPAGPLPLVPHMLGLKGDAERERRRFSAYANLASGASLLRLTCSTGDRPAALADVLERELAGYPAAAVGGAL
jgi:hypothetical protein